MFAAIYPTSDKRVTRTQFITGQYKKAFEQM